MSSKFVVFLSDRPSENNTATTSSILRRCAREKKLSYHRENARRATSVEILSTAAVRKIPFETMQHVNDLEGH